MNLRWNGRERIAVPKATVWAFVNDPAKFASCLPEVRETKVIDAHNLEATVGVAVGPLRGKLKFKIALQPRADGSHLDIKIAGGGLGSSLDLHAGADLTDDGGEATILEWQATAAMRGPIAAMGGRTVDSQAERVIGETFANVKKRLGAEPHRA